MRPSCETVQMKPGLCWRPRDAGDSGVVGYLPKKGSGGSPRERNAQWSANLLKKKWLSPLTSDMELQDLEFALLCFSLAWGHYFLTMSLSLPSWNGNVYFVPLYVGSV